MRMLVIEDDARARTFVSNGLREEGHVVDEAGDGDSGLELALSTHYDAIVADRMLPGRQGLDVVRALRDADVQTPFLLLTALGSVEDRVEGLTAGADDYLVKPFAFSELSARIQALVRRPLMSRRPSRRVVGDLEIDLEGRRVTRGGQLIELTAHEYKLLERLAQNPGATVTRSMLLETLWGFHVEVRDNLIDAHISRLRAKIDRGQPVELIHTVRGVGYVLRA